MPVNHIRNKTDGRGGAPVALEGLPPVDTSRWVAQRKAQIVAAVQAGLLTVNEACETYKLTLEEFIGWQRALQRFGMIGLQVCQIGKTSRLSQRKGNRKSSRLARHHA